MRKLAIVFALAVITPSLVLAWLAVRSLRDQQFVIERQQSALLQGVADAIAREVGGRLVRQQQEFAAQVESLLAQQPPVQEQTLFDDQLRTSWPLAEVGFCVDLSGAILCPSPVGRPEAQMFCAANSAFLGNRETAEVYWNIPSKSSSSPGITTKLAAAEEVKAPTGENSVTSFAATSATNDLRDLLLNKTNLLVCATPNETNFLERQTAFLSLATNGIPVQEGESKDPITLKSQLRKVTPAQTPSDVLTSGWPADAAPRSKVVSAEAGFHQLIAQETDGMMARFFQSRLNVMFWHRSAAAPQLVFGAQLHLARLVEELRREITVEPGLRDQICVALLDDNARPVALSNPDVQTNWKRPIVATEIGDALPHWEIGVYLLNPARLTQAAQTARLTVGMLVGVLVLAIAVGSWLIASDLRAQLRLARQKTDFVSNVSHELKTPLTSIRMFAEMLAERRVAESDKQRQFHQIIASEASRLTRLINNVLDFARTERGEKRYSFAVCELNALVAETAAAYRPQLEAAGFRFDRELAPQPLHVRGDRDALAQVLVNLLSNAEKYSGEQREIVMRVGGSNGLVEIQILDRGLGVPRGCEGRIFEQFYRAHDSLSSGIQGSGLGLTLARQIARAHGGDVLYLAREGGGSCFALRLPAAN